MRRHAGAFSCSNWWTFASLLRPSIKGWSDAANPVSRNSADSNYAMGWPLHTSLTHNLQRSVAPLSPLPIPRPAHVKFFQTTTCLILFTQITVRAVAVQWLLLIHASSAQHSSRNRFLWSRRLTSRHSVAVWAYVFSCAVTLWFIQLSDRKPLRKQTLKTSIGKLNASQICIWWIQRHCYYCVDIEGHAGEPFLGHT